MTTIFNAYETTKKNYNVCLYEVSEMAPDSRLLLVKGGVECCRKDNIHGISL